MGLVWTHGRCVDKSSCELEAFLCGLTRDPLSRYPYSWAWKSDLCLDPGCATFCPWDIVTSFSGMCFGSAGTSSMLGKCCH